MASSLAVRFTITVAGFDYPVGQPFAIPSLDLAEAPAMYDVVVPADDQAILWEGAPLPSTFDFALFTADQNCDLECEVNGGDSMFTVQLRTGGFPVVLGGDRSLVGGLGGSVQAITKITAKNRNTLTDATVSCLIAQESD